MSKPYSTFPSKPLREQLFKGLSYQNTFLLRSLGILAISVIILVCTGFLYQHHQAQQLQKIQIINDVHEWVLTTEQPTTDSFNQFSTELAKKMSISQVRVDESGVSISRVPSVVQKRDSFRTNLVTARVESASYVFEIDYEVTNGFWLLMQGFMWSLLVFLMIALPFTWWTLKAFAPIRITIEEMTDGFRKFVKG
jgi:hypothetical protein